MPEIPDDAEFIMCNPTAWGPSKVPGSIVDYCSMCKQAVNASPTTQAVMDKLPLVCIPCGNVRCRESEDGGKLSLMPGQAAEIERAIRKQRERDDPPVKGL